MKEKKCKVCSLFDERKFSDEIRFDINKLIKSKEKLEVLNKQTGFNFTNKHYYKVHHDTCLLSFEIPIEEQKTELIQKLDNKKSPQDILNTNSMIELYREKNLEDKKNYKLKLLDEIEFLVINTVHHELINGRSDKGFIPKDDISCLKIVNDIMKSKIIDNESINNIKFDFLKYKTSEEIFNNGLNSLYNGYINIDEMLQISKLISLKMNIDNKSPESNAEVKLKTREERLEIAEKLNEAIKNLQYCKDNNITITIKKEE